MGIVSSRGYKLICRCGSTAKRPFQKKASPDGQKIELNFGFFEPRLEPLNWKKRSFEKILKKYFSIEKPPQSFMTAGVLWS